MQARLAWKSQHYPRSAPVLIEIMLVTGDAEAARKILEDALARSSKDEESRRNLESIRQFVEREEQEPGWNRAQADGRSR